MNISKTMFKNFSRCRHFPSLYDLYTFRNAHHLREIEGIDIASIRQTFDQLPPNYFSDEHEKTLEIFASMFDEESGNDLLITSNAQMEAFKDYFSKIEVLAGKYLEQKFKGKFQYSLDTKEQKYFAYDTKDHRYYCYLDIYLESDDHTLKVFEVKATTSNKFFKLGKKKKEQDYINKSDQYDSIFIRSDDQITRLKEEVNPQIITDYKNYQSNRLKLFNRFSSDGCGKYVYDLSVERFIVENSLKASYHGDVLPQVEYYLVVLNCDYCFDGFYQDNEPVYRADPNGNQLFDIIDLTQITKEWQEEINNLVNFVEENIYERILPKKHVGPFCELKKSTQCLFRPICYREVDVPGSILEFIRKQFAFKGFDPDTKTTVYDLINLGYYKIDDLDRNYLTQPVNQIQYDCYTLNQTYYNYDQMIKAIRNLQYPLFHLDFETFGAPLPRYCGEYPYTQSLFQYSLHIEKTPGVCDKDRDHYEYLAPDHQDHRKALCFSLIKNIDLSSGGTIIVYNEAFEKTRLKEMAKLYPDLAKDLMKIHDHIFDLMFILQGSKKVFEPLLDPSLDPIEREKQAKLINYYHNQMRGSYSIKKILPLFTNLSYQQLAIHNGTEAVLTYGLLPTFTEKEYQDKYLALHEYCKQDTWAMVEILWGIKRLKNG